MITQIKGLHHVTSLASGAMDNNAFFTTTLGLRRVKKTVNFDNPEVYHLYYGDQLGTPGTVMTYFPFPGAARGQPGTGEVGVTAFAVPKGSLDAWEARLEGRAPVRESRFDETRLSFTGPDGERLALVEADDARTPWTARIPKDQAIKGLHAVELTLTDTGPEGELLKLMGYELIGTEAATQRFERPGGAPARAVDLTRSDAPKARQSAGSVHHVAFAVDDRAAQLTVRQALVDAGYDVTEVRDRNYFFAIYFRTPGGVLFEVATNEPGFAVDEDPARLGEGLKLPQQHEHLRAALEKSLEPL